MLEEPTAGRVRVTVRDAATGAFVPKVQVKVIGSGNSAFLSGETDLRGVHVAEGVRGQAAAVARKGTAQYAFYRGTTPLGALEPPAVQLNAPGDPAAAGQPGRAQQANGQPNGGRDSEGAFGGPDGGNWGGGNRPWGWSGEDTRQFRGEIRQWSSEAQALRRDLREQGIDVGNLDEILRRLREFDSERVYQDPEELLRLQSFVVEGLKRFEYDLRRRVDAQNEQLFLAANDEAPASFRRLIEEYYRVLSKDQGR